MAAAPAPLAAALLALCLACPRPAAADPDGRRFALAMMHFNVQYVAGGMVGFVKDPDPVWDLGAEGVEDRIITESLEPVLDLFLAHPGWATDIEMQAYALDVMAARHPAVLDKLRRLSAAGRIDVASFHYSDQLFLAAPPEDWRRSAELAAATFDRHGVRRSGTVFCQEGQAGPGLAGAMKDLGYQVLVWPKNLFSYQHKEEPALLYRLGDVSMITTNSLRRDDGHGGAVEVAWTFVDDGELLATGGQDPYLVPLFKKSEKDVADYEAQLLDLEGRGYRVSSVAQYLAAIQDVAPAVAPPLLDGTWQPRSTDGVLRWLGGSGLWSIYERDNDVRTLGALAHRELVAAELIARKAGLDAKEEIDGGFRLLALGTVTDATGINPFRGEIEYGIAHLTETLRVAREVIRRAQEALGGAGAPVLIDTAAGVVTLGAAPEEEPPLVSEGPLPLGVDAGDRAASVTWRRVADRHYLAAVHFGAGTSGVSVTLPGEAGDIVYTPALTSAPVALPRAAFAFDHYQLALSDGLLGLGGGWTAVADLGRVHLAARIEAGAGGALFSDATAPAGEEMTWVFHFLQGDGQRAAEVARALNVLPRVWR